MKHLTMGLSLGLLGLLLTGCSPQEMSLGPAESVPAASPPANGTVTVYYFHRTLRCISCLTIEKMARDTLRETYTQELAQGTIRWQPVDYWQDAALAKQFGVDSPTLVVAITEAGRIASYRRLDDTWALKGSPGAFHDMLVVAVNQAVRKQPA